MLCVPAQPVPRLAIGAAHQPKPSFLCPMAGDVSQVLKGGCALIAAVAKPRSDEDMAFHSSVVASL